MGKAQGVHTEYAVFDQGVVRRRLLIDANEQCGWRVGDTTYS